MGADPLAPSSEPQLPCSCTTMGDELIKLTDLQSKKARDVFRTFDKGDVLKVGNISDAFKKMGQQVGPEFMERHDGDIDENGTGFIALDEFEMLFRKKLQEDEDEKELREIFRILDKDRKGEIPTKEIRWTLTVPDGLTTANLPLLWRGKNGTTVSERVTFDAGTFNPRDICIQFRFV